MKISKSVEQLFKVKVEDVQTLKVKGKSQAQPVRLQHQADLEEGLCPTGAGSGHRLRGDQLRGAMSHGSSKEQADISGSPSPGTRRQRSCTRVPYAPLLEKQSRNGGRNNQRGVSPRVT
jgi:hypothetical protein